MSSSPPPGPPPSGPPPSGPPPSGPPPSGPPPSGPPPSGAPDGDVGAVLRSIADRVATGDWRTASLTALTAYGTALLGSLLFMVVLAPDISAWDWLVAMASLTAATFTIDVVASASGEGVDVAAGAGTVPLVLTTLSLAAACWVFHRGSRRRSSYLVALGDAARAGVLLGGLLLVTAIVFRTDLDDQVASVDDALEFIGLDGLEVSIGINRASAFFLGLLVLFGVLALAGIVRRDWLGPRMRRVHDVVAAPLTAIAALVVTLPALGILAYLALLTGDVGADQVSEDDTALSWHANLALRAVAVSNAGVHFLSVGAGGRFGGSGEYDESGPSGGGESDSEWGRLGWLADQTDAWGLWFSIPVMLLVIGGLVWLVHRLGRGRSPLGGLLVWGGGSFLVFGWLLRMASAHGDADLEFDAFGERAEGSVSFFGGSPFAEGLLLGLITLVASLGLAAARGLIDVPAILARLRQLQTAGPATTPPPPPPGPPGGTPPPPPPPPSRPPDASPDRTGQPPGDGEP